MSMVSMFPILKFIYLSSLSTPERRPKRV
jgi:hypothetical protein